MPLIERIVAICCYHARAVVVGGLALGVAGGLYTDRHFALNSNSEALISSAVPWRQHELHFDAKFPVRNNLILVVVDGATPELAETGAYALAARLTARKDLFLSVRRPDGGAFFDHNGMLFLPEAELQATLGQLFKAQPFLSALAADPSLRGIMDSLSTALLGVQRGETKLADFDRQLGVFGTAFSTMADDKPAFVSWRTLLTGAKPVPEQLRRFIEVRPKLNFDALEPGGAPSAAIRDAARALNLTPRTGVRVRLTGPVPLADEEFATLAERALLMVSTMMAVVFLTLWLATRSARIVAAILLTLAVGLSLTMAFGLLALGTFNIISIAFIALFVGLGVDFGIQFSVRYRNERHYDAVLERALMHAGRGVGTPLALAAAATAAGFLSFMPTDYTGVAQLGLIAGTGMIFAFLLNVTLLPALLMLFKPGSETADVGFRAFAGLDHFLARERRTVLIISAVVAIIACALAPFIRFDSNPLDLRSRKVESVSTLYDLMKDPQTSPNTIDVIMPRLTDANALAVRIAKSPLVAQTLTLSSFIPEDQSRKLVLIADARTLLGATLDPFEMKPPPSDAETTQSLTLAAQKLRAAAGGSVSKPAEDARRLAGALERLVKAPAALRARASKTLMPGLRTLLDQLRMALEPERVTLRNLPPDLVRDWIAPDGTARIQVFPRDISNDPTALGRFSDAVLDVAPDATGAPISIRESGRIIVRAFLEAGLLSFLAIAIILGAVLRRARDVTMTLLPLLFTFVLTLASCVALGLRLNFANIIALPLLLGIGVAFNIYFVVAWRAGARHFLQSSLARAVIFSAATTAAGFGTLWLSSYPGTASMGQLLMISLAWTLVTTLFLTPAMLGPPPEN